MEDREIVKLYLERSEKAITESRKSYSRYCRYIANRILDSDEDVEEVENDTYMKAWNRIPPDSPDDLGSYLAMLCRGIAIDRYKSEKREKRGGGQYTAVLDELAECVSDGDESSRITDRIALRDALNRFLATLPEKTRIVFMKRYFWVSSVKEISEELGMSESAVKMLLLRTRDKLKTFLEQEGFTV